MPKYRMYYAERGPCAKMCEEAYNHLQAIAKVSDDQIWGTLYHSAPSEMQLRETNLPVLVHQESQQRWSGKGAVNKMRCLLNGTHVQKRRYAFYSNETIPYTPTTSAIECHDHDKVMAHFKRKAKGSKRRDKSADVPDYLNRPNELPILVTLDRTKTSWYGIAAIDMARMIENLD